MGPGSSHFVALGALGGVLVLANDRHLTRRELDILRLVSDGLTDREIGEKLGIGRHTVSNHVSVILVKLNAGRRTEAVARAFRLGLIELDQGTIPRDDSRLDGFNRSPR